MKSFSIIKKLCVWMLVGVFSLSSSGVRAEALMPDLPRPGQSVALSSAYVPAHLKGLTIDVKNPFKLDFVIYRGQDPLAGDLKNEQYSKLVKYFMAALAVPEKDQWVNLSPYEKDRIIADNFGKTDMGRDLLAQDYILKQVSASLTNPESVLGKSFWERFYAEARQKFNTSDIPADLFNKIWIMPDKAVLYQKDNAVYVVEQHLKVMLEEDYLAMSKSQAKVAAGSAVQQITVRLMRELLLPAIEREVNEGKNFALVRQVYSGMLLAAWYKRALRESILNKAYGDSSKTQGIEQDAAVNLDIYERYLASLKAGAFNMIREDMDQNSRETIPRKYFSGGALSFSSAFDNAQVVMVKELKAEDVSLGMNSDKVAVVFDRAPADSAMKGREVQVHELYWDMLQTILQKGEHPKTMEGQRRASLNKAMAMGGFDRKASNFVKFFLRVYLEGVVTGLRHDELQQSVDVADAVIAVFLQYPEHRRSGLHLIFNPRTYGEGRESANHEWFGSMARLFHAPNRDYSILIPKGYKGDNDRIARVLSGMRELLSSALSELGDSDLIAAEKLVIFLIRIDHWQRQLTNGPGAQKSREIGALSQYSGLRTLLVELADAIEDRDDRNRAYMHIINAHVQDGKIEEAYGLLLRKVDLLQPGEFIPSLSRIVSYFGVEAKVADHLIGMIHVDQLAFRLNLAEELTRIGSKDQAVMLYENMINVYLVNRRPDSLPALKAQMAVIRSLRVTGLGGEVQGGGRAFLRQAVDNLLMAFEGEPVSKHEQLVPLYQELVVGLLVAGEEEEAARLARIIGKEYRVGYWGVDQERMENYDRSLMARAMAEAWAEKGDVAKAQEYLDAIPESKLRTMQNMAKFFAWKGEFDNKVIQSVLDNKYFSSNEVAELGIIMLQGNGPGELAAKFFIWAAARGMSDDIFDLMLQSLRLNRDKMAAHVKDIIYTAYNRTSTHDYDPQWRKMIYILQEFYPRDTEILQRIPNAERDRAMSADRKVNPGGIDMSAAGLDMQIKRDGMGMPLPAAQQSFDVLSIKGLVPVILEIKPAATMPMFQAAAVNELKGA